MKKVVFIFTFILLNILFINEVKAEETINYQSHVQNIGWQNTVKNNEIAGTTGRALRLEALKINVQSDISGDIEYQGHVESIGWQNWVKNGELAGTTGRALQLEAIKIKLTGELANKYNIYYRAHVESIGWQNWVKNGELAGTTGRALQLEAIQIKLVPKSDIPILEYSTHSENLWQDYVKDGEISGSTGKAKSIDALKMKLNLPDNMTGKIDYQLYITPNGWLDLVSSDSITGTYGKNIEAIKINLTGDISKIYDIYYRVHVSSIGWMGWTKNGKVAGTNGYFNSIEAVQAKLVLKDSNELSEESNSYKESINSVEYQSHIQNIGWQNTVKDGEISGTEGKALRLESFKIKLNSKLDGKISYKSYVAKVGWQNNVEDYNISGTTGLGRSLEAIQINISGTISNYYDIYYRVHVSSIGWLDWAKNGEKAGSVGNDTQIEAIQVKLIKKGLTVTFATSKKYVTGVWKNNNTNYYNYFGNLATGFKFIDGVKYFFNMEGTLMAKNAKEVIDVSSYQGNIDWNTIKRNGDIDSAIIRVGWGMSYDDAPGNDSYFNRNIDKVRELGIPYSIYIYSYARVASAAEKEANFVAEKMSQKALPKSTFIWYDVEQGYSRSTYETVVPTFVNKMKSLGYNNVGVYGNISALDTSNGYLNSPLIKQYPIWVAQYYKKLQYSGNYNGWQYSSSARVDGITGVVDINMFK